MYVNAKNKNTNFAAYQSYYAMGAGTVNIGCPVGMNLLSCGMNNSPIGGTGTYFINILLA